MRYATILILILFNLNVKGQKQSIQFGSVTSKDFLNEDLKKYSDEPAVILFDRGQARFVYENNSFKILFERVKRIKIQSKAGLAFADISIPFYVSDSYTKESVYDVKAISHNLNNGVIDKSELNESDIFIERINDNWRQSKFAIPNVREGTIIEFSYSFLTPFMLNLPDWEFQNTIPTLYSEYQVSINPFYEYTYLAQGIKKFDHTTSYKDKLTRSFAGLEYNDIVYEFALKDIPKFYDTDYITSVNDYIIKMDWQLASTTQTDGTKQEFMTSWPQIVKSMIKSDNFGKYIKSGIKNVEKMMKKDSELQSISKLPDLEKAKSITQYVKNNYSWNNRRGKYTGKSIKDFLKETSGSTAEINLFLVAMLKAFDLEVYPILLSTRDNGKIKVDYPFDSFFNTVAVVIKIDNQYYLTEATEKELGFGKLPAAYLNEKGLIVDEDNIGWIDLDITIPSVTIETMELTLDPSNLKLEGQFKKSLTDYDAIRYLRNKQLIQSELDNSYELIGLVNYENRKTPSEPYIIDYKASFPISTFEGDLYFRPFLNKAPTVNPFKSNERAYPVDFNYSQKKQFSTTVSIPDGFETQTIPEAVSFSNNLVEFNYQVFTSPSKDKITAVSHYELKKAVYQPDEFKLLKSYLDQITSTYNKQVRITKK
jgi:hypothetical protein